MTVLELVRAMSARLEGAGVAFGHGTSNAFDEAVWLALWRLGLPLDDLDGVADRLLTPEQQTSIAALVDQRIRTRKPAAYLTGEAWLQGLPFHVDERVIVPRSLIAEPLVEGAIDVFLPAEPALALAGGHDGMDFVRRLLPGVARHLTDTGALVLEIGHERVHFEAAFPHLQPLWLSTSAGVDQVLLLTREQLP